MNAATAQPASTVKSISARWILDSHLGWTPEFDVCLDGGRIGRGSAPRGETISTYEDANGGYVDGLEQAVREKFVGGSFTRETFDAAAMEMRGRWGSRVVLALSVAFHSATRAGSRAQPVADVPRLLLNVLNGGLHAYTNPVESDFHEFMLLPRTADLRQSVDAYLRVLSAVGRDLAGYERVVVGGNAVHRIGSPCNEACLDFLTSLLDREGLRDMFSIAVDASAGDWSADQRYELPVSGGSMDSEELISWWISLVTSHGVEIVEDPMSEADADGWRGLRARRPEHCTILGDNYTSTTLDHLVDGGRAEHVDGVLIKPNQNATVSGSLQFAQAARDRGLMTIASHRSVETESTFLIDLALAMEVDAIKIGPFQDFSTVVKFNELLRLTEA